MAWVFIALAPIIGGFVYGFERVLRARMQRRIGPPIMQPFYDMFKLMDKRTLIIHAPHAMLAVAHFFVLWFAIAAIFLGWSLLYIVFIHLVAQMLLVLAGYSVKSIFSHIGSNRELVMLLAYEPILLLIATGFYLQSGSFEIGVILSQNSYLFELSLLFIALLFIIPIKVKKSPFDSAEAHQEIVGGVEVEYSGLFYEFLYMAKMLEYIFIYAFVFIFGGVNFWLGALLVAISFLVVNLVDNATARVRVDQLLKITYTVVLTLVLANLVVII